MPDVQAVPQFRATSRLPVWCWLALAAFAVVKLALVAQQEILLYSADDQSFAYSAAGWYWERPYAAYSHVRQPVYPLFVAGSAALGFPLRISIELVWIGACAWSMTALRRCGAHPATLVTFTAVVLFHPWLLNLNSRVLADTLYTPLLLVFLTGAAAALLESSWRAVWRWAWPAAAAAALAANTRQESILVYGSIAVVVAVVAIQLMTRATDRATATRRVLIAAGAPLVATVGLTHSFRMANHADIGVYSAYDLESPGYRALYKALLAIPPEIRDPRLPVPRDVREKAYQVSPTFATLRDALEGDPRMAGYAQACERQTGVKGEYGAWTCWAIRQAVWVSRQYQIKTARDVDPLLAAAAAEIRQAMRDGRLEQRFVPLDFLPPEWGPLLPQVPRSAGATWRMWTSRSPGRAQSEQIPAAQALHFETAALRRTALSTLVDPPSGSDAAPAAIPPSRWRVRVMGALEGAAPVMGTLTGIGAAVGLGFAGVVVVRRWLSERWLVLMAILMSALAARLALVVALDATGIDAQRRYLLPASVLAILVSLLAVQGMIGVGVRLSRRSSAGRELRPALAPAP